MTRLWLDLETYSETPITYGTYRYAEASEILLLAFAFDNDAPTVVDITSGEPWPDDLIDYIEDTDGEVYAHNSNFDRTVLRLNGFKIDIERWRDTRIQAYANALPGSLGDLCQVLGLPTDQAKNKDGKRLIQLFCKPLGKNRKLRRATRETHPEEWQRFKDYAAQDIVSMRECHKRMSTTVYPDSKELAFWHLDQHVNDKGFAVDQELIEAVLAADKKEKARLKNQTAEHTDNQLESTSQRDAMIDYLAEVCGLVTEDLTKDTVKHLLESDEVEEDAKELLRIRLQVCSTSTAKYSAVRRMTNTDGICRGSIQHMGAKKTGRSSGKGLQPQNLPSRGLLSEAEIDFGIDALKGGFAHEVYPNLTKLLVSTVRGVVVARPGCKLVIADYSNIEGRVTAWAAGEAWKLDAFRAFDAGTGPDLYNLAYSRAFKVPLDSVTKDQRQIGKVLELFLGYQGGVKAFLTGAATYGFDIDALADKIYDTLPADLVKEAMDFHDWMTKKKGGTTYGLSRKSFVTCDVLKRAWRNANPSIVKLWSSLEGAAIGATNTPGETFRAGRLIAFKHNGSNLAMRLPSGRLLMYPGARLDEGKIVFLGDNIHTHKWGKCSTYGGKLCENLAQAISRDLLFDAMLRAWKAGYETVLHVHDELVTEVKDTKELTVDALCEIMVTDCKWTKGLPLAAAGFETRRYRK
jgi:DNA polymerase bacteriophage-type